MHGGVSTAANAPVGLALGALLALLAPLGCGEVGVDASDSGAGSGVDAAGAPDATGSGDGDGGEADAAAPLCAPDAPFTRVQRVDGLNDKNFQCCAVLTDPLTAYFAAGDGEQAETADLFRATRPNPDAAFDTRELLVGKDTEESFWAPTLSQDGKTLYYNRAPAGDSSAVRVFRSPRNEDGTFSEGEVVDLGDGAVRESDPAFSDEGLVFIRNNRLHFAAADGAEFSPAQPLTELDPVDGGDRDLLPAISFDGATLYWGSSRLPNTGDTDIWLSERGSEGVYGEPAPIQGVNGPSFDAPSFITPDQCELYFTTTRGSINEIWVAVREPK